MYDAKLQTTESEREAKDQITEQANKYARNGGRRHREPSESLSRIDPSSELKVENEMLSAKMRLAKAICRNQVKFGEDAEKFVSDDAKKAIAETTQLLENVVEQLSKSGMIGLTHEALKTKSQMRRKVHQVKEGREVLEKLQELSEENGKDDTEWKDFAARFNILDAAVQQQQGAETLEGVSVSQSSLSVRFDGSGQPAGERNVDQSIGFGVTRNTYSAHSKFSENTRTEKMVDRSGKPEERNSSNAQVRTLLEEQRQMIIADYCEKIGHHELQAAHAEEERRILREELWRQQMEFREVHQQSLTEMEELRKFQSSTSRYDRKTEAHRGPQHYFGIIRQNTRITK